MPFWRPVCLLLERHPSLCVFELVMVLVLLLVLVHLLVLLMARSQFPLPATNRPRQNSSFLQSWSLRRRPFQTHPSWIHVDEPKYVERRSSGIRIVDDLLQCLPWQPAGVGVPERLGEDVVDKIDICFQYA